MMCISCLTFVGGYCVNASYSMVYFIKICSKSQLLKNNHFIYILLFTYYLVEYK